LEESTLFSTPRKFLLLALTGTVALSLFAAACGDDDDGDDGDDATPTTSAASTPGADSTPSESGEIDISGVEELSDGTLTFGSDIAYAPIEFLDESTNEPAGLDIDLGNAIGEVLGVEVVFENAAFDGLIPALDAERYDALMSAMTVNPTRSEQVDFIEYFTAGSGIVVVPGNPEGIASIEDLCGHTVAVQEGTVQAEYLEGTEAEPGGQSQACTDAGNEAITILKFPTNPEAVQAVLAGQADANMADYPVAAYSVQQNEGEIELITGYQFDEGNYGIALRKDSTALRDVIEQALDQVIADGTYGDILAEWGLEAGALE
jgi:polar amino acid transport system substrate-binding protein